MRKVAIRKAYISPQEYQEYLEDVNPLGGSIHSLRLQPAEYKLPAEARSLMSGENVFFRNNLRYARHKNIDKLPLELDGVPLGGRFTYPAELFSFNPDFQSHSKADVPSSYKHGNRPLHLYGFEGKNTPQRYAEVLQPEGIIYGDVPESDIQRITNRPIDFHALRMAATALMPTNNLSIDELKEKEIEAAKQLIAYGIPPVLSEDVSPVTLERTPQSWESIEDFHDPFQQWSKNQQLLNEPLTDFTFPKGEPMEIAFQLLKEDIDYQDEEYIHPHEQIWNDEADEQLIATTNSLWDYVENMSDDDKLSFLNNQGNYFMNMAFQNHFPTTKEELDRAVMEIMFDAWQDSQAEMPGGIDFGDTKPDGLLDPVRAHAVHPSQWKKLASEPMEIAFQLLKERVSPEAKRHKLEYDKKYESSPERIKYREQLNQERRKRGIYGSHDHKDISHTEGGKLTLEGEHENRARHFKDKGTLREL